MRYRITLRGISPLITNNGAAGLDTRSAANIEKTEITRKKASDRTVVEESRLRELECLVSLYLDEGGAPTLPPAAFRANIETAARKLRHGPKVREGLLVEGVEHFDYDRSLGTTAGELALSAQFTTPIVLRGRGRLLRTRARFDPWAATILVETDPELVDRDHLVRWLDIGGPAGRGGGLATRKVGAVRTVRSGDHRTAPVETFFGAWLGVAWLGEAGLGSAPHGRASQGMAWTPPLKGWGKR